MESQLLTMPTKVVDTPPTNPVLPKQGQWHYAQLCQLTDDGRRYEIINGTLYLVNAPSYDHQMTAGELLYHLQRFVGQGNLGVVDCAPCGVYLPQAGQFVQPDIVFWRGQAAHFDGRAYIGVPALVVEVLAPKSMHHDRVVKFDLYEASSVEEYWLADPMACTVEVYTLSHGEYALAGRFSDNELIQSNVLPGLAIRTRLLFSL
jgi:Uma2 family endonuclease